MSRHSTFPHPSHHHSSLSSTTSSLSHNNPLQARIALKRAELANLQQLRDLSATLATQMSTLEQKLSMLRDGTEAVACVLANWDNVLGVIGMVGASAARGLAVNNPDGEEGVENEGSKEQQQQQQSLPETLVRIPVGVKAELAEGEET